MSLQTLKEQKGFTIVELLIVIVVIGILAAITIVAFNGIQNRANNTAAKAAADTVLKKAEAYNSIKSSYPVTLAQFNSEKESEFDNSNIILIGTAPTTKDHAEYTPCVVTGTAPNETATGATITWRTFPGSGTESKNIGTGC